MEDSDNSNVDINNKQNDTGLEENKNDHFSRMPYYRYNNAYGNYRGGYDRSNHGPPPGFGPPMPPPFSEYPNYTWRREYGGPSDYVQKQKRDRLIRHLIRCGLPKDQVNHLPGDLLRLMSPMNCGLCAQKFDTFDISRIHYLSRNHLKNQKKWVTHHRSKGAQKQWKEPLKPRESYCELCDVNITSTGHAESHYAGKSHRGIVERRRNPKNPFLLQPNMERRVNALIRRENKFLKTDLDGETPKFLKNSKNVPPELYCNICKISMMCSDQMTTHLNGKRHLSKEKQHILKLMKGETDDDKKNVAVTGNDGEDDDEDDYLDDEYEDGDGDVNEDGNGNGADASAADDGWGSGGEDWKPSAEDY